ncbi:MAG TPA: prepilin-type N-terminal cleavage/methylation domain-containing protein [Methylomirabilota bacterium]|nr:prepilin-type N-terminal cleavage/methylation domain-containing protein [Methylomirabilota bacterium]
MKRLKGFTLVEILVVILIILILAGVLFPVILGVKSRAQQTKCALHMRQIGIAISMYAQDHDDMPPQGAYNTSVQPTFPVPIYTNQTAYRVTWEDILIGMQYLKSYEIFICPAASNNDYRSSYGVNRWIMKWETSEKLESPPYPTYTALISEKEGPDWPIKLPTPADKADPYYFPMDPRHSNKLNVLFLDGHVKTVVVGEPIENNKTGTIYLGNIIWKFK